MSSRRILVVDDDAGVRSLVADVFCAETDSASTWASDGFEAIRRLEAGTYDLIMNDRRMPGLDGAGLYREVERRWPAAGRRGVFISGSNVVPDYEDFLQVPGLPFSKPFNIEEL